MTTNKEITIKPAKGRPMLTWVGKRPLRRVTAFPAQLVERFSAESTKSGAAKRKAQDDNGGLLFHGDNKEVLAYLLANGYRGKVKLICIDPPFDSGADYVRKVQLRGPAGTAKLSGESYTLGEQIQYTDIWANDNYLQFMYERLLLMRELITEDGSIFLHCDQRRLHHLRCLMDEVFGAENFINEIIWQHQIMGGSHEKRFPKAHETVLWYAKGEAYRIRTENPNVRVPFSEYVLNTLKKDEEGKWYYERRRMSRKATVAEAESKAHTRTYVDNPESGTVATDVWSDMLSYQELPNERQGIDLYPTQKPVKLLTRMISAASDPKDLVMDCFGGSGTAVVVAQQLGRRWIVCDINKGAIQTTAKRLQAIMNEQASTPKQAALMPDGDAPPPPAQLSFAVYRVNDYDLQVQHNEAVNLACEHLGITRTKTDGFFDGTRGKKLVKIVPFNHPLSPLDLEEIKRELSNRPDETRDVLVVCLGKQLDVEPWLDAWNAMRKKGDVPNKLDLIELRTDPQYGHFFEHQPALARLTVKRAKGKLKVTIQDFISPSILERLKQQAGILSPQIHDWRAMVDSVMIDSAYDGHVFNIALADVPERKSDLVLGEYELAAPTGPTTVAVKITDMLGEELLEERHV
jgi:DNA modification methylase